MMKILVTACLAVITFDASATVTSAIRNYDLSEKCSYRAEKDWKARGQDLPGLYGPRSYVRYENHYSIKRANCYVMHTITQPRDSASDGLMITIFNVNDHKVVAEYMGYVGEKPLSCWDVKKTCTSMSEWEKLMKTYLED